MKKTVLAMIAGLVAVGIGAPQAGAGGNEKTYWLGEGPGAAEIAFIVNDGKLRELVTFTNVVRCSEGSKVRLGNGWDTVRMDENDFEAQDRNGDDGRWFAAGHIGNERAHGRMRGAARWFGEPCESDFIRWEAEQVSKAEWDEAHEH